MRPGKLPRARVHDGFGDWMRNCRENARPYKYGLRELAGLMPASASYLSRLETGDETSPPSEEFLERWCEFTFQNPLKACWHARRIPRKIHEYLTKNWDGPALGNENVELRDALLGLYRLHVPETAEDKLRHQEDPNGWSMMLHGRLNDAAKVLGIDRDAEAKVRNEAWDALMDRIHKEEAGHA